MSDLTPNEIILAVFLGTPTIALVALAFWELGKLAWKAARERRL